MEAGPSAAFSLPAAFNRSLTHYHPLEFLDKGGFGFVVLAKHKPTKEMVAIKFVECK
jgi:hypothetical protein